MSIDVSSGPLQSLTFGQINGIPTSFYDYGTGTLRVSTAFALPDGSIEGGSYTATIRDFRLSIRETSFGGFSLDVLDLVDGEFDENLANYLGVRRRSPVEPVCFSGNSCVGEFNFDLDFVTGDPTSPVRVGALNLPQLQIYVAPAVPEPGITALGLVAAAALLRARNRRCRRA
jgi:hypothetical protein